MNVAQQLKEIREQLKEIAAKMEGHTVKQTLGYDEAAKALSVSPRTISRMVALGELRTVRVRGKAKIPVTALERVATPREPTRKSRAVAVSQKAPTAQEIAEARKRLRKR